MVKDGQRWDVVKRTVKNILPWRVRYFLQLQTVRGNIHLPNFLKQHPDSDLSYDMSFIAMMEKCGIAHFSGMCVCEMGPGESLSHACLAYQLGATSEILLDIDDLANSKSLYSRGGHDSFANKDIEILRELPIPSGTETWQSYLPKINAAYFTNGIDGYRNVPNNSVDHVFSNAVLEHVRKRIFVETIKETYRFMKPGAIAYHTVDFKDHFGGNKNQLRFPDSVWEDDSHYKMAMYTNRISCSSMCNIFEKIGFHIEKAEKKYFPAIPIQKKDLADEFRGISDEDLMISGAVFILKK